MQTSMTVCTTNTKQSWALHVMSSEHTCVYAQEEKRERNNNVVSLLPAKVLEEICKSSLCAPLTFTLPPQLTITIGENESY